MDIKVITKNWCPDTISLDFKVSYFGKYNRQFRLLISDGFGRETAITFNSVKTFVPSTLLSRWCNHHLQSSLLRIEKLASVETIAQNWNFREGDGLLFGLNAVKSKDGKLLKVKIDDSIGMKNVEKILNSLDYSMIAQYDVESKKVKSIKLTKQK